MSDHVLLETLAGPGFGANRDDTSFLGPCRFDFKGFGFMSLGIHEAGMSAMHWDLGAYGFGLVFFMGHRRKVWF
jgi:hypothetical protein